MHFVLFVLDRSLSAQYMKVWSSSSLTKSAEESLVDVGEFWIRSFYLNTPAFLMHKLMAFIEEVGMWLSEYVLPAFW